MRILTIIAALTLPGVCILTGILSRFSVPSKPNMAFGFRTRRSSSSIEAWQYANKLCGFFFIILGTIFFLTGIMGVNIFRNTSLNQFSDIVSIYAVSFMIFIVISIVLTQILLCQKYDINGNIKN